MTVHHLVAADNVDANGTVIEPGRARHGALVHGRIHALAGEIDADTHLNLDFDSHRLFSAIVVERLAVGAMMAKDGEGGFVIAHVTSEHFERRGRVDVGARRVAWLEAVHAGSTSSRRKDDVE